MNHMNINHTSSENIPMWLHGKWKSNNIHTSLEL